MVIAASADLAAQRQLHDLTGEAQVLRALYPEVADSIHLDQLLLAARGRVYETCQTAAADSTDWPSIR